MMKKRVVAFHGYPGCSRIHAVENDTIMLNYCKNIKDRS